MMVSVLKSVLLAHGQLILAKCICQGVQNTSEYVGSTDLSADIFLFKVMTTYIGFKIFLSLFSN